MICPSCDFENIEGTDECENCMQPLTDLEHATGSSPIERSLTESTLESLHPNPPILVAPDTTVAEAVETMASRNIGCVIVGSLEDVVGILTERDLLMRLADRYADVSGEPVTEFMTPNPETLDVASPIAYALNRMSTGDFRHLPVTNAGQLVGIISLRDVLGFLSEWYPDLIPAS